MVEVSEMRKFKIGDRVKATSPMFDVDGQIGTITAMHTGNPMPVYPIVVMYPGGVRFSYTEEGYRLTYNKIDFIKLSIEHLFEEDV